MTDAVQICRSLRLNRLINAELQNTVPGSKAIAGIEMGKLEIRPGLLQRAEGYEPDCPSVYAQSNGDYRDPRSDRALISNRQTFNPQPNPQNAMSYTTSAYLGSPRGLLSR